MLKIIKTILKSMRKESKALILPEHCLHLDWLPETKENGYREECSDCGIKAYGSCQ